MPQNRRPPGWLPNGDPDWDGTTVAERRQAQNTYDLLVEQEKANELAKEKLQQDRENARLARENAERIAEATREAEEDRLENELYVQQRQHELDKEMRYYKLCDELGLNYDDIRKLSLWVIQPTNEQRVELYETEKKADNIFFTDEINELYEKMDQKEKEYKITVQNNKSKNRFSNAYISVKGVDGISGGTEIQLNKIIKQKKVLNSFFNMLILGLIICLFIYIFSISTNTIFIILSIIIAGLIGFIFYYEKFKLNKSIKIIKNAISNEHKAREYREQAYIDRSNKEKYLKEELSKIEKQIDELEEKREKELSENEDYISLEKKKEYLSEHMDYTKGPTLNALKFNEFRKNNYNLEIERLFRKLEITTFSHISEDEIVNTGTVEDYNKFIENIILNIDSLYFENYTLYSQIGINEYFSNRTSNDNLQPKENLSNFLVYNAGLDLERYIFNNVISKLVLNDNKTIIIDVWSNNIISEIYDQHSDYLFLPIINDVRRALGTLAWIVREIQERENKIKEFSVSNIEEYNNVSKEKKTNIILIIDNIERLIKQISKGDWADFQYNMKYICYNTDEKYGIKIIATMEKDINNSDLKGLDELFTPISEEEFKKYKK